MNEFYYYFEGEEKKGPYTLPELRTLNLSLEKYIWCEGWLDKKRILDCLEVLDYLVNTPPVIPSTSSNNTIQSPSVTLTEPNIEHEENSINTNIDAKVDNNTNLTDTSTSVKHITYHPYIHWIPKTLMAFGIISCIVQTIMAFVINNSIIATTIVAILCVWAIVSIGGMLAIKRWGLISYFLFRLLSVIMMILLCDSGLVSEEDMAKDIISLITIIAVFFIKADGYNVYKTLWYNGEIPITTVDNHCEENK